jgi:hypothetical protein
MAASASQQSEGPARAGMTRFTPDKTRDRASLAGYAWGKELPQCWQKRAAASTAVPHTEQ